MARTKKHSTEAAMREIHRVLVPLYSVTRRTVILGSRRREIRRRCNLRESDGGDLGTCARVPAGGKRDERAAKPYCKASYAQVALHHGIGRKLERPEWIRPVGI